MDDEDKIHPGRLAPDFTLPDQEGRNHRLSDYRGKWVFLYFYPKDDLRECEIETCAIRDRFDAFGRLNVAIFGISTDSIEHNRRLVARCKIPFAILSDAHQKVTHQYRTHTAYFLDGGGGEIERTSFLIDIMGDIEKMYKNVKPKTHAEEVLKDLEKIKKENCGKAEF